MVTLPDPDWDFDHALLAALSGSQRADATLPVDSWQRSWRQLHGQLDARLAEYCRGFAIRRTDALAHVASAEVRRRVRGGEWTAPCPGALVPVTLAVARESPQQAARRRHAVAATATLLGRPGQSISGRSAAVLHGLPTLAVPHRPELTADRPLTSGHHGRALVRSAGLTSDDVTTWFGARVTTVARTVVDLARHDRRDGLIAVDAALRERLVRPAELADAVRQATGWPGVRQARAVIAFASPLAESPVESLVRLALHDDGFPPPELQVPIGAYRVDLAWPAQRVIIEADGRGTHTDDARWRAKQREHDLRQQGYTVIRVRSADLGSRWTFVREMVRVALLTRRPARVERDCDLDSGGRL